MSGDSLIMDVSAYGNPALVLNLHKNPLSTVHSTWNILGLKSDVRGENQAYNRLNSGKACFT
jgi:hypothetical protein